MKKLDGKIAIVTAASKEIGGSIAKHLATEGAAVVVNYAFSKEAGDRVVDEITSAGGKAIAVQPKKHRSKVFLSRWSRHSAGSTSW
ncbi:SDR family NAD(P)-dependent oxidoreductase [Nostoc sp.]|uniref:SDR family NAD(P)-dependent oxidoreductase n=1 Tax=Nostoc sp. TaxID=1180 RepID=UPI002FF9944C